MVEDKTELLFGKTLLQRKPRLPEQQFSTFTTGSGTDKIIDFNLAFVLFC